MGEDFEPRLAGLEEAVLELVRRADQLSHAPGLGQQLAGLASGLAATLARLEESGQQLETGAGQAARAKDVAHRAGGK